MTIAWRAYQEEAAVFFRSLGLTSTVDATVSGVRTSHDVDVLVRFNQLGVNVIWVVECKNWKTPISKLHVLALRAIVSDVGADRGILLSEVGFQSGAIEAAQLANIVLSSLAEMRDATKAEVLTVRLRELYDRVERSNDRYWAIPKHNRIAQGLRPEVGEIGYSGARIIDLCKDVLSRALRGSYPFRSEAIEAILQPQFPTEFESPAEVVSTLEPLISELEDKLNAYEATLNSA
ncbi:MAG: restriction endonuclease [Reyranella sp.]|uniref:restriction endonuclease n=1 Tax=Reyranella sp. TaxID=1929291 RepID=UPI0025D44D4E|nr:restriction endonuclease [Reyranella sp.]MBR2819711.1 restriction endonuclease [Reyranella sp.]